MPVNYFIDPNMAFTASLQGAAQGNADIASQDSHQINQSNLAQNALKNAQDTAAANAAKAAQLQYQSDVSSMFSKGNITARDIASLAISYPSQSEQINKAWANIDKSKQQGLLTAASQVQSALLSGQPNIAKQILAEQAAAAKTSGDPELESGAAMMSKLIDNNPSFAAIANGTTLAALLGPEKFYEAYKGIQTIPSDIAKTQSETNQNLASASKAAEEARLKQWQANNAPNQFANDAALNDANIRNLYSQIQARTDLSEQQRQELMAKVQNDTAERERKENLGLGMKLDVGTKKFINQTAVDSAAAYSSANSLNDLATKFSALPGGTGWGSLSKASEGVAGFFGNEDDLSLLRKQHGLTLGVEVLNMLPKGSASDRDVALAREPFLKPTANKSAISSQLRGMAKVRAAQARLDEAKVSWVSSSGSAGDLPYDMEIDGVQVKRGTKFTDFAKQRVAEFAKSGYGFSNAESTTPSASNNQPAVDDASKYDKYK